MMAEQTLPSHDSVGVDLFGKNDRSPEAWLQNKKKMMQILKDAPVAGIYKNQDPKNWQQFFQFYIDFLNAQTGPRGQCSKRIRKQLLKNKQEVDQVLQPYNLTHTMHIRSIYVHFKFYIPCRQYHEYITTIQSLDKSQQSLFRLKQPQHPMYVSIKEGMVRKRGQEYPYLEEIAKLRTGYQVKIEKLKGQKKMYEQRLEQMVEYRNWVRMKKVMKRWFDQWVEADSGMGKESCNRGQVFQDRVLRNVVPYIILKERYKALKHIHDDQLFDEHSIQEMIFQANQNTNKKHRLNRLHVFVNMKWIPRALGEIDITIAEYVQQSQRYEALILIQCKARLFDIRQASYQVDSQYLKPSGKTQLSGKYGPVYTPDQLTSYIVTTLPDFQFVLPIQSQLKAALDRNSKDKPIQTIRQEQVKQKMFADCLKRFGQQLSPLQWLVLNDSDNIVVLSSQV